jgi:hypothetical protein
MLKITTIQRFKVLAFRKETISNCLFIIFTLFSTTFIKAQQTNSPFSYLGVGEVATGGTAVQDAMGGLGVASSNGVYISTLNPALLARNRYTTFEMGVNMEGKIMQNDRRQSNTFGGKLNPIMLSLPASSKWTLLLGLVPVSNVDYETFSSRKLSIVGTDSINYTYSGDGGLNKAIVSNGVRISKDMYVGLETAFMFGVINRDVTTQNFSDAQNYQVKLADRTNYSGVNFKLGWAWRPKISKSYFLNVGATADFAQNLSAKSLKRFTISDASGISLINADTLNNVEGTIKMPATYRIGVSLENPAKLNVSFDYSLTQWSGFKNLNGSNEGLRDSHTFALGAEYIPKFDALNGYFNHVMYRAGVNYTTSPYAFNGTTANDMSFSVGASFPLRTISYFNVAYVRGKRGILATSGLEEVYNKIVIGFSLGDFYWFRKPKID